MRKLKNIGLLFTLSILSLAACSFGDKESQSLPEEYTFNFHTEQLALTNFDILIGDGYFYIPESYYFEKQTSGTINSIRLELMLDDEVVFEFTTGELFNKQEHTLPLISKIIPKQLSKDSNLTLHLNYSVDDIIYTFDENIKLIQEK
ncbi:MAG: hypothetical protein ACRCST_11695 [Turicibacter sp.]